MPCGGYENCPLFPAKGKGGLCGGRPGADGLWMNGWTRGTGAVMAPGMRLWRGCLPAGEAVDVFAVVAVEFDEGAEGVVSEVEFVDESGDVFFPCADVGEAGRHADLAQEGAEGVDAGAGCGFGVGEVHVASPDADGELCEACDVVLHDVFHPCGQDDGKACAVCAVVKA